MRKYLSTLTAGILVLGIVANSIAQDAKGAAASQTFTSPQGFTLTPAPGWIVASKDVTNELAGKVQDALKNVKDIDLNKFAAVVYNTADPSGAQNMNVVVSPDPIPIDESGVEDKLSTMLRDQFKGVGITIDKLSVNHKTIGTHAALLADMESTMNGTPIRQWQAYFPSADHTLIVTCTAPQSLFTSVEPAFNQTLESMTFPEAKSGSKVPGWLTGAIIGGGIGLVYGIFVALLKKRKPAEPK
jgi:hypothetical protein